MTEIFVVVAAFCGSLSGALIASAMSNRSRAPHSGEEIAALVEEEKRRIEPPPLPKDPARCEGKPGCTNRPVTQRHFQGGGSQRLCAPCATDPGLVPPEHRLPGTPGAISRP